MTSRTVEKSVVRKYLLSGRTDSTDPAQLARECDLAIRHEAQHSLRKSLVMARKFVKRSEKHGNPLLQTALRSLGRVHLASGNYAEAESSYLEARSMLRGEAFIRGQVDRTLMDIYMYLGKTAESNRCARLAIAQFKKLGAEVEIAKTWVNKANLLHRQDRHRDACVLYEKAIEKLQASDDVLFLSQARYNLANSLVQLFDFDKARQLYSQAQSDFNKLGYPLHANECRYGLAWLSMLEGDYHLAVQELTVCSETYRTASQPKGMVLCRLDMAEAYLGLNLLKDAARVSRDAERMALKLGIRYEAAKGALFNAKSMMGMGQPGAARKSLERAIQLYRFSLIWTNWT